MSDVRPIRELLGEVDDLRAVLDDLNVKYVRIASNGHWSYEKLGRSRHGRDTLERGLLLRLADLIPPGRPLRSGEWALRKCDGVTGPSILIERLPIAVADRLPQEVLATLKKQVRQSGNGVLVGEPGSGKGGLLLWLALQIPDQPVLYVAENPPSEFPGTHIMHVYPPSTADERRGLERFVRLSQTVMWDRVVRMEDLQSLYGFPGAGRRWFTTDATSVRSALRLLTAAGQQGSDARFSTMLHLASSVIGRPEARNLLLRDEDGWSEAWSADESMLDLLEAYESNDIQRLGPTEMSVPGIDIGSLAKVEVAEDFAAEAESADAPVEVELSKITEEEEAVARPFDAAVADAFADESDGEDDNEDDYQQATEAITGMLARQKVRELREQGMVADDATEIAPSALSPPLPERTRAYVETPDELLKQESTNPAAYAAQIVPDIDDIPSVPELDLEDLRITTMEDVEEVELLQKVDDLAADFSGVFEGDLDFDSLAEEMLSEISEVDPQDEAIATDPNRLVIIEAPKPPPFDPPDPDESTDRTAAGGAEVLRLAEKMSDQDREDSTKEFTLNERLMLLRKRRHSDD